MSSLSCDKADLAWALKAVLPHALPECGRLLLRQLCGLRLEVAAGALYVAATDQYTLGVARVAIGGDHREFEVTLDRADVPELLRKLKGDEPAMLALHDDKIVLDGFYRYRPLVGAPGYPSWRKILGRALRAKPCIPPPDHGGNADHLARFRSAVRSNQEPLVFMPVSKGRLTVVIGQDFAGAAASIRSSGEARAWRAGWCARIPAEVKS
jgi:hypothetical protein